MFTEMFPLDKKSRSQLSQYICSQIFQDNLPKDFSSSYFWENLQNMTYIAVNWQGVIIHSGHNFTRSLRDKKLHDIIARALDVPALKRLAYKMNAATQDLLSRHSHLKKKRAAMRGESLTRCAYVEDAQYMTVSLRKALAYNPVAVYGAIENLAHIRRAIKDNLSAQKTFTFFELGAGAGNTTLAFLEQYPSSRAIICDLPEAIAVAYTFISYFSEKQLRMVLPHEFNSGHFEAQDWDILCILPQQLEKLPDSCCDILCNANSMQEMDKTVIDNYFRQIKRLGREQSFFYCKNLEYSAQGHCGFNDYP